MASEPTTCAGSWRPVPHLEPGDGIVCVFCKRQVYLRPPPVDLSTGPWPGELHPRIEPHTVDAKAVNAPVEVPWSEG
jgi:hypothetical protein